MNRFSPQHFGDFAFPKSTKQAHGAKFQETGFVNQLQSTGKHTVASTSSQLQENLKNWLGIFINGLFKHLLWKIPWFVTVIPRKHSFANCLLLPFDQEQSSQSFETAGWNDGRGEVRWCRGEAGSLKEARWKSNRCLNNRVDCWVMRARCFLKVHQQNYRHQWTLAAIQWIVIQCEKKNAYIEGGQTLQQISI